MIRHMRHGSPPRLMALQSILNPNRGESLPAPSAGNRITPFDRGDIKDLITSMDDAIDQIQQTAKVIGIFGIHSFEPEMRSMADRIVQCAGLIVEAVPLLSALHTKAGRLRELCDRIRQVEGQADDIHDAGLQRLYEVSSSTSNPTVFLTGQEVYKHLESAVDCFDDIANVIDGLVVEHT
jgi:uncharacterized protein Yka (UPF0111/DUF47 family)